MAVMAKAFSAHHHQTPKKMARIAGHFLLLVHSALPCPAGCHFSAPRSGGHHQTAADKL